MDTKSTKDTALFKEVCSIGGPYEPPCIEVVEIYVEKGFANSTNDLEEEEW
jgi:hypothetical protein